MIIPSLRLLPVALALALAGHAPIFAQTPAPKAALPKKPVDLARDRNLYVVGYAHLDTQWRWTYPHVIQSYVANTMRQNFPLFEKYPDYVFNFTGSRRYEFMKEYYPEDYEKVKKYVASGQWFPAGSSVDENDANVPSTESFVRQFLYGNHFFQREFGRQSEEFMLPDCFGFPASLPTLLTHAGIKGFSTQKLTWGSAVGIPFSVGRWIGPDGTSVVAALNPLGYGGSIKDDLSKSETWLKRINKTGDKSGVYADYHYYGTGDRGGAPKEESAQGLERSMAGKGPIRVISSAADQMFKDITPEQAARLPAYTGEMLLTKHSAGSITSQAYMKRWNRKNEYLANAAESAVTAASWMGAFPYPRNSLYRAWDLVLGSQMHDILPGTSLPKAYEYSWNDEVLALNQFAVLAERGTAAILSNLDTTAKGLPVAVYNPLSIEREDLIEADLVFPGGVPSAVTAYDPSGRPVPTQILGSQGNTLRVLFLAKVPSVGYAIYDVRPEASPNAKSELAVTANSLENQRYRVTLDKNGDIASIFDKALDRELLAAPVRLSFHTENPKAFPAWNMDWKDRQKPARAYVGGAATITIVESGPARVALEVKRTTENSTFAQQIRLAAGGAGERLEISDRIDWQSQVASLKADFTFAHGNPKAAYDDKVGVLLRGNNNEKRYEAPMQRWMDLTAADGGYGVSVLSDSKYGSDKPDDHTLRLTLLYTPGVDAGYHDEATQDHGRHDILTALYAHSGDWAVGRTAWQSERLNQPLRAFLPRAHPGPLGKTFSFASLNTEQVEIGAIKQAEDSDEIVVRLKELTGKPAVGVRLKFPVAITAAREVDAQERPLGPADLSDGALACDVKPFSLRAFAIKLAPPPSPVAAIVSAPVPLPYDVDAVSRNARRNDGAMDAAKGTFPAEMLPKSLVREGVEFQFGPTTDGAKNAVAAQGQTIGLPAGEFDRVHLLVAAADGDVSGRIKIGDGEKPFDVPSWTGFIGQWDNRVWSEPIPEESYGIKAKMIGLIPGFIKRTPVAWFATHHHAPKGDAFYEFSSLFQLSYDLPKGAKTITLPQDPKLRVFAASVSREPAAAPPASPLYDTLADHHPGVGAPSLPQDGQTFHEMTGIVVAPPLYFAPGDLHYTLDGSDPTAASPAYDGPILAMDPVKIAVRQIAPDGTTGAVVRGMVDVQDSTPPRFTAVQVGNGGRTLELQFSKPLSPATAEDGRNYTIKPPLGIKSATISGGGQKVSLSLSAPIAAATAYTIGVRGIKDASRRQNAVIPATWPFNAQNLVYNLDSVRLPKGRLKVPVAGLPLKERDAWTMNLLVRPDVAPEDETIIAGFGQDTDRNEGAGRYFAKFENGIHFWSVGGDLDSNSPLEVGRWQMLTATFDGKKLTLYKDGAPIAQEEIRFSDDPDARVSVGPIEPWDKKRSFEGSVKSFTIRRGALTADEVKKLYAELRPEKK